MKLFTLRHLQWFDLIMVTLMCLLFFHSGNLYLVPLTLLALRLLTSFSLLHRQKAAWLPVSVTTLWTGIMAAVMGAEQLVQKVFAEPFYVLFRSGRLLWGRDSYFRHLSEVPGGLDDGWFSAFMLSVLVYVVWFVVFPLVAYGLQWKRKAFTAPALFSRPVNQCLLALFLALMAGGILSHVLPWGTFNIWLFVLVVILLSGWQKGRFRPLPSLQRYLLFTALFFTSYLVGRPMDHDLSWWGLLLLPAVFYALVCRISRIAVNRRSLSWIFAGGMAYWIAQFATGGIRYAVLAAAVALMGYAVVCWYRQVRRARLAVLFFGVQALLLPVLTLGYNPYACPQGARLHKFVSYAGSPDGLLLVHAGNHYGLRDRFGTILPCQYERIEMLGNEHQPFVKVRQNDGWGIYDLERHVMVAEPHYISVEPYNQAYYRLKDEQGQSHYFRGPFADDLQDGETHIYTAPYDKKPDKDILEDLEGKGLADVEHQTELKRILAYVCSTYSQNWDVISENPQTCWYGAADCRSYISTMARDYAMFTDGDTGLAEQAEDYIGRLVSSYATGTGYEMYRAALITNLMEFHRTMDGYLELAGHSGHAAQIKEECSRWISYVLAERKFYSEDILGREWYAMLPNEISEFFTTKLNWRYSLMDAENALFLRLEPYAYEGPAVTDGQLSAQFTSMRSHRDYERLLGTYEDALMEWLDYRDEIAKGLAQPMREAYENVNLQIRKDVYDTLLELDEKDRILAARHDSRR